jgi:HlyD family secretion protein
MRTIIPYFYLLLVTIGCGSADITSDAYGNFESDEVVVSAQTVGVLILKGVGEGDNVVRGQMMALVDTLSIYVQKQQLLAQEQVLQRTLEAVDAEAAVLREQRSNVRRERDRVQQLYEGAAATQKQLDDAQGALRVVERQLAVVSVHRKRAEAESSVLKANISVVDDQLRKAMILSPVTGTILTDYAHAGEWVSPSKPLFRVANLDTMTLRAFVDADQYTELQLGDRVEVLVDDATGGLRSYSGRLTWIASKAEFTPRTIQTRKDRVTLVYAIKIRVPNDGFLKIGMPGEVVLRKQMN